MNEFGISGEDLQQLDSNGVLRTTNETDNGTAAIETKETQQNEANEYGDLHEKKE